MASRDTRRKVSELVSAEVGEAQLGDSRRNARLRSVTEALARAPGRGITRVFQEPGELEGFYRFTGNHLISYEDILQSHRDATFRRAREQQVVLSVGDTTEMAFGGSVRRAGLGALTQGNQGFFCHTTVLVSGDHLKTPLGIAGFKPHSRPFRDAKTKDRRTESQRVMESRGKAQADKESDRWRSEAVKVEEELSGTSVIHVFDRESDSYALLAAFQKRSSRYVIRAKHDRILASHDGAKLRTALTTFSSQLFRPVPLSRRPRINRKGAHPSRAERTAELHVRSGTITLPRPQEAQSETAELSVNVVQVFEPNPPQGEEPIDWTLLTSEPIATDEQIANIVDWYRARWLIEEYFKALKTGCGYETSQLEDYESLLRYLAMLAPIAWALLVIRSTARETPTLPATTVFTETQVRLLRVLSVRVKLGPDPNVREAFLAVAGLGGHLKRNGEPGWQTLNEGLKTLLFAELVHMAAQKM